MGWNTTVVVMNDALHEIREDKEFGAKLVDAIQSLSTRRPFVDVSAGCHVNAATVIESHHADQKVMVAVGGNSGENLGYVGYYRSTPEEMLKKLAEHLGYRVVKKSTKKVKP